MAELDDRERELVPSAIRGWLEIGLTERERKMLALALLAIGTLSEDMDQALALACKLGIMDIVEAEGNNWVELVAEARGRCGSD